MVFAFNDCVLYHQIKTPIGFWCRRGLNLKSLIQPSEILPVELIYSGLNPFSSPLYMCVCVCVFVSKDNCPTLLKRVCYVQYNLSHIFLKVTIIFEQSLWCVFILEPIFLSLMCVCVCVFLKKKKKKPKKKDIHIKGIFIINLEIQLSLM